MAETTGTIYGGDMLLYLDGTAVGYAQEHSITNNLNFREITSKESTENHEEHRPTTKGSSITSTNIIAFDAAKGIRDLNSAWLNATQLTVKSSNENTGDEFEEYTCYIESLEKNYPNKDNSTLSITFKVTGKPTISDVT